MLTDYKILDDESGMKTSQRAIRWRLVLFEEYGPEI